MAARTACTLAAWATLAGCTDPNDRSTQAQSASEIRLANEATAVIGEVEGLEEYLLDGIAGAARMDDGDVVVVVEAAREVRRYAADGQLVWRSGREGEGPGEYRGPRAGPGCISDQTILVRDWVNRRITVLGADGEVRDTWSVPTPFLASTCSPSGRIAFTGDDSRHPNVAGPYRSKLALYHWDGGQSTSTLIRGQIPGEDRWSYVQEGLEPISGPRPWGRTVVFAATDDGVWLSTGDGYEIELVRWSGRVDRVVRWSGPDPTVTPANIEARREQYFSYNLARRDDDAWRRMVEDGWKREESQLPDQFPSVRRILVPRDGGVWVQHYYRPGDPNVVWVHFDDDGSWTRTLRLPPGRRLLDIGETWALVRIADALERPRLFIYSLIADGET